MSDGGKGSKQRPMQISQQEWENRWDAIFARDGAVDDYQDILSTEDCVLEALEALEEELKLTRNNEETQQVLQQRSK